MAAVVVGGGLWLGGRDTALSARQQRMLLFNKHMLHLFYFVYVYIYIYIHTHTNYTHIKKKHTFVAP